jgi:hypothetical protein
MDTATSDDCLIDLDSGIGSMMEERQGHLSEQTRWYPTPDKLDSCYGFTGPPQRIHAPRSPKTGVVAPHSTLTKKPKSTLVCAVLPLHFHAKWGAILSSPTSRIRSRPRSRTDTHDETLGYVCSAIVCAVQGANGTNVDDSMLLTRMTLYCFCSF